MENYHSKTPEQALEAQRTTANGLTGDDASQRA